MRVRLSVIFALVIAALVSGCGGGGGGGQSSSTPAPQPLHLLSTSIHGTNVVVDPRIAIVVNFDSNVSASGFLPSSVQLSDGTTAVPVTLTFNGFFTTITPTSNLKTRTNYQLTIKAGIRADSGGVLQADFTQNFRTLVVSFDSVTLVPPDNNLRGSFAPIIAVGDINGDGRPDIVQLGQLPPNTPGLFPQGYTLNVYAQNAQGAFNKAQQITYVLGQSVFDEYYAKLVLLDIDGDGIPEILVPEYLPGDAVKSGIRIFKQAADGNYAEYAFLPSIYVKSLDVFDVDGDGRLDLIGSDSVTGGFQVFFNTGAGLAQAPVVALTPGLYYEFWVADLNQDGQREIIVDTFDYTIVPSRAATKLLAYSLSAPTVISENLPLTQLLSGVCSTFNRCTNLQVIDINDDGWPDLLFGDAETPLTAGVGGMVSFMRQPGAGFVEGIQTQINGIILSPIDMDGDGLSDIPIIGAILFQTNFLAVALGNKALDFEYTSPYPISIEETLTPSAVAVVDINGDGKPDVVLNGANEGIVVMLNHKF